jgi:putative hydrolase of HD superfamily
MMQNALNKIVDDLGSALMAEEIRELWLEYEGGTTLEADVAMQLDKFEMIIQANEYEVANPGKRLESFFNSTKDSFTHPEVRSAAHGASRFTN